MKNGGSIIRSGMIMPLLIIMMTGCTEHHQREVKIPARKYIVAIKQMQFLPATITVNKGDTVLFVNQDMVSHNVTDTSQHSWTSSNLLPDKSWAMVASATADYYCTIHPVMKGKIIVQ